MLRGDAAALVGERAEGDRKTQRLARRDAMLPIAARFARKQIGRARRELEIGAHESGRRSLAEAEGRRAAERDADHLLEYVAVAVPADARAGIVSSEQHLDELVLLEACEGGGPFPKRLQPVRNRLGGREARVLEIVAPAEALRPPVADEAVEAERRQFERLKTGKQLSL